ncbi:MAG: NADH-quinone oxidoreductase subunit NuoB, partial [Anaerolineales bacterium]
MGLEQKLGSFGVVTTSLEKVVNWSRTRAMWPMLFGLACCAIEMMSAQSADYDMSRFGMELMRASPRQSDLMIVAGRVSRKMAPVLRR